MADRQSESMEETMKNVENAADEEILAAMVKTAIRSNVEDAPADETVSLSQALEQRAIRGQGKKHNSATDAQHDGFRYDYDDNI